MRDMHTDFSPVVMIGPEVLSADNTPAAIDLQGFDAATIEIAVGVGGITFSGTNKVEFKLTHSDDDSTYTAVEDKDIIGATGITSGIIFSLKAAHAAATVDRFGYIGNKRYLKLLADFSGTHGTGTPIAANCWRGHAWLKPTPA